MKIGTCRLSLIVIFGLVVGLVLFLFPQDASATLDFTPPQNISNTQNDSINPFVVADGENIFLVWSENSKGNRAADILFSKSIDGGETFSAPKNISNQQGGSIAPSVSIDGNNIFVTWTYRYQDDQYSEIFFSKSTDGGNTFTDPKKISDNKFSTGSRIAAFGNNIFVAWTDIKFSSNRDFINMEIFFSKSTDGGETFSVPQNLSNNDGFSSSPSIAMEGDNVLIVWQEDSEESKDIVFSKSIDGGDTFSAPLNISNSPLGSVGAKIAKDGDHIFVTWFEFSKGIGDIFFSASDDGGATFSAPLNISKNSENSIVPFIVAKEKEIFITWTDATIKGSWITLIKSDDAGVTFSAPQKISNEPGFSDAQSISTDGKILFAAWNYRLKMDFPYNVLFSKSINPESLIETNTNETSDRMDTISEEQDTIPNKTTPEITGNQTETKSIQWLDENGANYTVGGIGVIKLVNPELNINKQLIDIPLVHVWSDTDSKGIDVDIIETGADTGIFYADISLTDMESSYLSLYVSKGDTMTVSFDDKESENQLVDTVKIITKYLPPLKQIAQNIPINKITCMDNHKLFIKGDGKVLCLTDESYSKLETRGYFKN